MKLGDAQRLFGRLVPSLLVHILGSGYEYTFGDAYRDPRVHGDIGVRKSYSHPKSAHKLRLAIDINLFKDGEYLQLTEDHRAIGEWWERRHPLCRWGGRFNDGNHYSLEWGGMK